MMYTLKGFNEIEESVKKGTPGISICYSKTNSRISRILQLAESRNIKTTRMRKEQIDKDHPDNRGIILYAPEKAVKTVDNINTLVESLENKTNAVVFLLDGITDPHNLGAIIRSSDLFGIDAVIVPKKRSAHETETVSKVSQGALMWVNLVTVTNINQAINLLKENGFWVYGAEMNGAAIQKTAFSGRTAIVMGREGQGLHRLVQEKCDALVSIPMGGHIDSLNVSVAAGLIMYEITRQRAE